MLAADATGLALGAAWTTPAAQSANAMPINLRRAEIKTRVIVLKPVQNRPSGGA
jgi:hypothetical protein